MSAGTHTPGPWRVGPVDDTVVTDADGKEVAAIDGDYNSPDEWPRMEANARLIAAAPELLGALRFILAFYEPGQTYLDTNAWKQAEASARRAVAKAEGRA